MAGFWKRTKQAAHSIDVLPPRTPLAGGGDGTHMVYSHNPVYLEIGQGVKTVYSPKGDEYWALDSFETGLVVRRCFQDYENAVTLPLVDVLASATVSHLVEDDGWWLMDDGDRKPLPDYGAITFYSSQKLHRITFVPDLKPFDINPFERFRGPIYDVLIDDVLVKMETRRPQAIWIDGLAGDTICEGRFLITQDTMFDFKSSGYPKKFKINQPVGLKFDGFDVFTEVSLKDFIDHGQGIVSIRATVYQRSTHGFGAEFEGDSLTYPWDEENKYTYWDQEGLEQTQKRDQIQRNVQYMVDLPKLSQTLTMAVSTIETRVINRTKPQNTAVLIPGAEVGKAYTLITSCGITLEHARHEAIWSRSGRYLAVVYAKSRLQISDSIAIIDFETATVLEVPDSYQLPSFIWFDDAMLEFTHVIRHKGMGEKEMIQHCIIFAPDYKHKALQQAQ